MYETPLSMKVGIGLVITVIIGAILSAAFFDTVESGYKGVVYSFGKATRVVDEGIYPINPFTEEVKPVEIRERKYSVVSSAGTKDLQQVQTSVAINYSLDPKNLINLVNEVGMEYEDRILLPVSQEAIKATVSKFSTDELLTKRDDVKKEALVRIQEKMTRYHILVTNVSFTDYGFSAEYNAAVERKNKAVQDAITADNVTKQIEAEGRQKTTMAEAEAKASTLKFEAEAKNKLTLAKAEAEAIRIKTEAIRNQGGADYVKLQWIAQWDGKLPVTTLGSDINTLVNLK